MNYDELRAKIQHYNWVEAADLIQALDKIAELHKPFQFENGLEEYKPVCQHCQLGVVGDEYPCETIQAIEKELK